MGERVFKSVDEAMQCLFPEWYEEEMEKQESDRWQCCPIRDELRKNKDGKP